MFLINPYISSLLFKLVGSIVLRKAQTLNE